MTTTTAASIGVLPAVGNGGAPDLSVTDGSVTDGSVSNSSVLWADAGESAAGSALLAGVQQAIATLTALTGVSLAGLPENVLCRVVNATEHLGRLVDGLRTVGAGEVAVQSRPELGYAGLAAKHFQRTPADMVVLLTRVSAPDARRRIRLARQITGRSALTGELPALFPLVGAAVREGRIGVEAAQAIVTGLTRPRPAPVSWCIRM